MLKKFSLETVVNVLIISEIEIECGEGDADAEAIAIENLQNALSLDVQATAKGNLRGYLTDIAEIKEIKIVETITGVMR